MKYAIDDPRMSGFFDRMDDINSLADAAPGFVWRLQIDDDDVAAITFFGDGYLPNMSVWENLVVAGSNTKWNTPIAAVFQRARAREEERRISAKAIELLDGLGLGSLIDSRLEELSAGDRKLVEFARQLMCEPRLLLLDEPAAGVNPEHMNRLSDLIRQIHDSGIGVLVIDHNLSFVLEVADYVYVLANGEVISEGTPAEVSEDPIVRRVYLGGLRSTRNRCAPPLPYLGLPLARRSLVRRGLLAVESRGHASASRDTRRHQQREGPARGRRVAPRIR